DRRDGIELEPVAHRARHPHAEQPFAVQRLRDGIGELAERLALLHVLARELADALRARDDVGFLFYCVHDDSAPLINRCSAGRAAICCMYLSKAGRGSMPLTMSPHWICEPT